jgi:hypothetical protein
MFLGAELKGLMRIEFVNKYTTGFDGKFTCANLKDMTIGSSVFKGASMQYFLPYEVSVYSVVIFEGNWASTDLDCNNAVTMKVTTSLHNIIEGRYYQIYFMS